VATPTGEEVPLDGAAVEQALRRRIATACDGLASLIPAGPEGTDTLLVLAGLAGEPEQVIRQLPSAAQEALALCNAPDASPVALTRLCERDPMIAQVLFRQANSAYYRQAGAAPCAAIRPAIERIGMMALRGVLLRVTVEGLLCRPGAAYGRMVQQVWDHMVRTGPIARQLAPAYGVSPDHAFALGLLHDVGKLVIFDQLATLRGSLKRPLKVAPTVLRDALLALHEPLGGLAAQQWGLGGEAAFAIASHHRNPSPIHREPVTEILYLAEKADLADVRQLPLDLDLLWLQGGLTGLRSHIGPLLLEAPREEEVASLS
jgi:HD-like signal output (HDOD) protein